MAEHEPSLIEKVADKIHDHDPLSTSDSDDDKSSPVYAVKTNIFRLFGRERPIHQVLGGGKFAQVFLWRKKKISAGVLGGATVLWVAFELMKYHLITLACHMLIFTLAFFFLGSGASTYVNRSAPQMPNVVPTEECVLEVVSGLRIQCNQALSVLWDIASGKHLKKFLAVIAGLWILSIVGSCCNFLTLLYIVFVVLHTVPVLYEKYEDQVDSFVEKAWTKFKKQYAVFDDKVLSKIPTGSLRGKKD